MARRNRAEVVVADEIGVYHCLQRVVRRAYLCGVDSLSVIGSRSLPSRGWRRLPSLAAVFTVRWAWPTI